MTRPPSRPITLRLYGVATRVLATAAHGWLARRVRRGKEDAQRLTERFGIAATPRPAGRLVWCHAASVGESLAILGLIGALRARGLAVVLTTGTLTSAALMAERLPAGAIHQFVPLDHTAWAQRFLDHWQPSLVLWSESELWPNMLGAIAARGIPAFLVNARISDRAFDGWSRWPRTVRAVLSAFTTVIAQSAEDARRYALLGADHVVAAGNLKLAADPLPHDVQATTALTAAIGARPAWLAASIHPGEDAVVAQAHQALAATFPDLLSLVAPRHPEKAGAMAKTFAAAGLAVARRSAQQPITPSTQVYIADTLGELGVLYRACDLVVMGKSFAVGGGQNPGEPAKLGCAVICGPDMGNFRDLTADLSAAGAVNIVADAAQLAARLSALLADPAARRRQGENGARFMAAGAAALTETFAILESALANPLDCR